MYMYIYIYINDPDSWISSPIYVGFIIPGFLLLSGDLVLLGPSGYEMPKHGIRRWETMPPVFWRRDLHIDWWRGSYDKNGVFPKKKSGETPDLSSILMIFMDWMSLLLGIQLVGVRACLARVKSVEAITGTSTHYSCRRAHRCPSPVLVIPTGVKWYAWYARCLWLISILVGEIRIYIRCDGLKWSQMFIIVHHSFVWDIQSTNRFVS